MTHMLLSYYVGRRRRRQYGTLCYAPSRLRLICSPYRTNSLCVGWAMLYTLCLEGAAVEWRPSKLMMMMMMMMMTMKGVA